METCFISEDFMKEYLRDMHPDAVIKNARIEDVDISLFRSSLVLVFHINYGNSCFQGYMSPLLTGDSKEGWTDKGAGNFISNFIRVFGIDEQVDLQSIKGKPCKVFSDNTGIYAICDFIDNKWFCPTYYFEMLKQNESKL
ncbi:MAG: hypothetical protein IKK93_01090 [Campylobacter sp.]|nr:hypothetical protein [Campylobacter sp.]